MNTNTKKVYQQLPGERVKHILCNLSCKQDGEAPHHAAAKYSELESMIIEMQGVIDAMAAHHGLEAMGKIVKEFHEKKRATKPEKLSQIGRAVKKFVEGLVNEINPDAEPFEMPMPNIGEDKDAYSARVIDLVHKAVGLEPGAAAPTIKGVHRGETDNSHFGIISLEVPKNVPPVGTVAYDEMLADLEARLIKEAGMPAHLAGEMAVGVLKEAAQKP